MSEILLLTLPVIGAVVEVATAMPSYGYDDDDGFVVDEEDDEEDADEDGDDDDDREDGRAGGGSGSSSSGSGSGSCAERGVESGDGYSKGRAGEARSGTAIDAFYGEATDEVRDALRFNGAPRSVRSVHS